MFTQPCLFSLYTLDHTKNLLTCFASCSLNSASSLYIHSITPKTSLPTPLHVNSLLFIKTQSNQKPPCNLRFMFTEPCLFSLYTLNYTKYLLACSASCSPDRASSLYMHSIKPKTSLPAPLHIHSTVPLLFIYSHTHQILPCLLRFMFTQPCLFSLYTVIHTKYFLACSASCSLNRAFSLYLYSITPKTSHSKSLMQWTLERNIFSFFLQWLSYEKTLCRVFVYIYLYTYWSARKFLSIFQHSLL